MTRRKNYFRRTYLPTPVMRRINTSFWMPTSTGIIADSHDLITVPNDNDAEIPRSMLVGNSQLTTTIEAGLNSDMINDLVVALMRVPKDTTVQSNFIDAHPEWVLAYKYIGSPIGTNDAQQFQPIRIRSSKKIRLYTGDSIKLVAQYTKAVTTTSQVAFNVHGEIRLRTRLE